MAARMSRALAPRSAYAAGAGRSPSRARSEARSESRFATPGDGGGELEQGPDPVQGLIGNRAVARLIQREDLNGDPANLQDSTGKQTTQHGTAGLRDAANAPGTTRAADVRGRRFVKVVADRGAPVNIPPETCPVPTLIYDEKSAAETGYTQVGGLHGTVDAPIQDQAADNSLYIDNRPQASDVQQYGIGDCYGLATIISIAARDPGKIMGMMAPDGTGGANVTFNRRIPPPAPPPGGPAPAPPPAATYSTTTVHADGTLAFELATAGTPGTFAPGAQPGGRQLHGAQLRSGQKPKKTEYWSAVANNKLEVHRNETYQMGRWAPVLEKAWARFAEVHGQYGQEGQGSQGTGESSSTAGVGTQTASGYKAIDGGWSHAVMTAFYGAAAEPGGPGGAQQQGTTFVAGGGSPAVMANLPIIETLFKLQGRGRATSDTETDAPIITATSMSDPLIVRLGTAITSAQADPDWAKIKPRTKARLLKVANKVTAYQTAITNPTGLNQAALNTAVATAKADVAAACVSAAKPGETWSVLQRKDRSRATMEMLELVLDLRNAGTDHSIGQRNVYTEHVYSVGGVNFALLAGAAMPNPMPDAAGRAATVYPQIDPVASTVIMQNPHHTNEPDAIGNGRPTREGDGASQGGASDGVFTFTLEQFLRNFSSVESGTFRKS